MLMTDPVGEWEGFMDGTSLGDWEGFREREEGTTLGDWEGFKEGTSLGAREGP